MIASSFSSNLFYCYVENAAEKSHCKHEEMMMMGETRFTGMSDFLSKFYTMVSSKLDALVGVENRRLHVEENMMEMEVSKKSRRTLY
jgi:hypothetical protein